MRWRGLKAEVWARSVQKWALLVCACSLVTAQVHAAAKYPQHPKRQAQRLDGSWRFVWLGDADWAGLRPEAITCDRIAAVPGVFDTALDNYGKRGTGVYRRTVAASPGALRLKIGGLGLCAKVWWDGTLVGEVRLPYASVDLDFDNPTAGEHTLTIAVDNRFSAGTAPLFKASYDFYGYGGIYRSLMLEALPAQRIERVQVTTLDPVAGRVRIRLSTAGVADGAASVAVGFDSQPGQPHDVTVSGGAAEWECAVPAAKPWSPDAPHLHAVCVTLGADQVIDRFGLRRIETEGRQILLNGQPIRLKGVNRHESHPEFGPVQNTHLMLDDIRLVRTLGGNFIRCVHYQHDPEFYELCDETGTLVWAESLGWGLGEKELLPLEPLLVEETRILGRIVANHPSVIIAGFLNECASDKASCLPLYQKLAGTLRETAPNTLVSYASNRLKKDVCLSVCDVVSLNYYPGWISPVSWDQPSSAQVPGYVDDLAKWFDAPENKEVFGKPLITSETGCCGVYGVRDRALAQWSEEYQADYLVTSLRASMNNPRFCGVVIWQMFDTRSFVNAGEVRGKFRGFNNAGLLDEYRRPKLAFDEVQKVFKELK